MTSDYLPLPRQKTKCLTFVAPLLLRLFQSTFGLNGQAN